MKPCSTLIRNATVWTVDAENRTYSPGAIAISGARILDVGHDHDLAETYIAESVLDVEGAIVHPGFVEGHTHVSMHLTREAFPDEPGSTTYFANLIRALNDLNPDEEFASALLAAAEMLRAGVTTFADAGSVKDVDAASRAIELVGMRALLADPFLWDLPDYEWTSGLQQFACDESAALERLGGQLYRNKGDALVRGYIALWGLTTAGDRLLLAAQARAEEAGVAIMMHQSMEPRDVTRDRERLGVSPLRHFRDLGFLGGNLALAHMNYLTEDDKDALTGTGTSVVWVPGNFLNYSLPSHTRSPVPDLVSRHVNIALGTDVAKTWGYGEQALLGYLAVRGDGAHVSAEALLEMATIGGARAVMMSDLIGSIEPNKLADLVIRDSSLPAMQPGINKIRDVMLGLRSKGVRTVLVNGEIVLSNGKFTRFDEGDAYELSRGRARDLMRRIGG